MNKWKLFFQIYIDLQLQIYIHIIQYRDTDSRWCMSTWVLPGLELCSLVDMGLTSDREICFQKHPLFIGHPFYQATMFLILKNSIFTISPGGLNIFSCWKNCYFVVVLINFVSLWVWRNLWWCQLSQEKWNHDPQFAI